MYTKDWYKKEYQKYKRRASWYELAYKNQTNKIKNLERKLREIEYKLKEENETQE